MNKQEARKIEKQMQSAGFETSLAKWSEGSYSVSGRSTQTGDYIRIDNEEQWRTRQPQST